MVFNFRYDNSQEEFVARVNQCVDLSLTTIYDPPMNDDPYCLKFDPYNEEIHGAFRKAITSPKVCNSYLYNVTNSLLCLFL